MKVQAITTRRNEIHADGCAHMHRAPKSARENAWPSQGETRAEVIHDLYRYGFLNNEDFTEAEAATHVHFAPCTKELG